IESLTNGLDERRQTVSRVEIGVGCKRIVGRDVERHLRHNGTGVDPGVDAMNRAANQIRPAVARGPKAAVAATGQRGDATGHVDERRGHALECLAADDSRPAYRDNSWLQRTQS